MCRSVFVRNLGGPVEFHRLESGEVVRPCADARFSCVSLRHLRGDRIYFGVVLVIEGWDGVSFCVGRGIFPMLGELFDCWTGNFDGM